MYRQLLSSIGACALDCSRRSDGPFFCDPNTANCEPCRDICHPSRGTMDECRDQIPCKDLWNMSAVTSTAATATTTTTATAAEEPTLSDVTLGILTSIPVVICVLVVSILVFVILRRRRGQRERRPNVFYKPPIPLSNEEQEREQLQNAAGPNDNCSYIVIPPEVNESRSPLTSA